MKARKKIVDAVSVYRETADKKHRVDSMRKRLADFDNDPQRAARLEKSECKSCFYLYGKLGGAAMTLSACGVCDTERHFANTCVDALCKICADKLGLCKHCGADIDLKQRRKPRDFSKPKSEVCIETKCHNKTSETFAPYCEECAPF